MSRDYDLICLSHLRWHFVIQRPQHLMRHFASERRVFFVEDPFYDAEEPWIEATTPEPGVRVIAPHLPDHLPQSSFDDAMRRLLDSLLADERIGDYVVWYYTPMALTYTRHLRPLVTVYDCMDELSAFTGAPAPLRDRERELLGRADLVFTGGRSLYETKRSLHPNVFAFPSSVDARHFGRARDRLPDPADQELLAHPRLGFFGVIDERLDQDLLAGIAELRPDWQIVMIGPVAKIALDTLPSRPNIHYLGPKAYDELPLYLAGWDVAIVPFARNATTRYISPTKTLEYLAGGKPVVSTAIHDVVAPYGDEGFVSIADTPSEWATAVERILAGAPEQRMAWQGRVDYLLARSSWTRTWRRMDELVSAAIDTRLQERTSGQHGSDHRMEPREDEAEQALGAPLG